MGMSDWIYPAGDFRIKKEGNRTLIFDVVRRKFVALTPEEWVRQHVIHYLIRYLRYPKALVRCESGLKFNKMNRRSDVVVYDRSGQVFLVVECKAATVKINQKTFDQLSVYNQYYHARYLMITNGLRQYIAEVDYPDKSYHFLEQIPVFSGHEEK